MVQIPTFKKQCNAGDIQHFVSPKPKTRAVRGRSPLTVYSLSIYGRGFRVRVRVRVRVIVVILGHIQKATGTGFLPSQMGFRMRYINFHPPIFYRPPHPPFL